MNLAELADASGLPARTIRFYIARGLLNGPVKAGRDAEYTAEHVAHLGRIKKLQSERHTLSQIARILGGGVAASAMSRPTPWWQHTIADDVVIWVRGDASPWRMKQIHKAIEAFASRVGTGNNRIEKE